MSILTAADVSTVMGLLASDAPIWVEDENGETCPICGVVVRNGQVRLQMAAKPAPPPVTLKVHLGDYDMQFTGSVVEGEPGSVEVTRHPHNSVIVPKEALY